MKNNAKVVLCLAIQDRLRVSDSEFKSRHPREYLNIVL